MAAADNINTFIGNTANDIEMLALPISHSFGLGRLRCVFAIGATLVLLGSFASMKKFYGEMERCHVTGFGMVPASWAYIMKMSGEKIGQFSGQLKYVEIGSAFMSLENKQKLMGLLPNTHVCMHYGLTEASRSAFISFHDEIDHLMSAGKPSPNTEIAVFSEQGKRLGRNEDGEICVKGRHVCSAYWGLSSNEFQKDFFDGYFRTGDWGHIDDEGYIHLISRKKEIINVGGKKVSPIEVEEVLNEIDGIDESACVGVHDDVLGEVVKAFCVCSKEVDFEEIKKIMTKKLENYKIPVFFETIDALPKTQNGKIQRFLLK
jgi:long-chain acyl-CoA synthetase